MRAQQNIRTGRTDNIKMQDKQRRRQILNKIQSADDTRVSKAHDVIKAADAGDEATVDRRHGSKYTSLKSCCK
jgi:hypothetical protein